MDKVILLPLLISAAMLTSKKPSDVFILVFLPALTLIPVYFDTKIVSGVPELYFWSAALIPIILSWAVKNFEGYTFHWMDGVILAYIIMIFIGQFSNSSYKPAQKIVFNNMMAIFFPYALVRAFGRDRDVLIRILLMMTWLGAFIAIFNMLEFRLFVNYFDKILRGVWPRYVVWDVGMVMMRWGFKRSLGPFSHPIIAGYFFSFMVPLALWAYNQNHYRNKRLGQLIVFLNVMGVIVSISRAPMMGLVGSSGILYFGWSNKKAAIGSALVLVFAVVLITGLPKFIEYASVTRATARTVDQRNIAYRKEMWEAYIEVALERPIFGWGKFSVPEIEGMDSIDAEYLGVALAYGLIVLGFYLTFLFGMLFRMFRFAMRQAHDDPWGRLAWALIAGWCSAMFTQATVYSGAQTVHYLYMLGGVGQVLMLTRPEEKRVTDQEKLPDVIITSRFGFERII